MGFQLSAGVLVVEKDLTNVVPAVATSIGGIVGTFQWGPVLDPVTISSEEELVRRFGKPNLAGATSFFSASNFLAYANTLKVVRVVGTGSVNAVSSGTAVLIKNATHWEASFSAGQAVVGEFAAKYPGALGNSLKVSMADSATSSGWTYADQFDSAPGTSVHATSVGASNDELHIIVIDEGGLITGTPGTILEKFAHVSKAFDAKTTAGASNYYVNVISTGSQFIWWTDHSTTLSGTTAWGSSLASGQTYKSLTGVVTHSLAGGVGVVATSPLPDVPATAAGWDLFKNAESVDVNLLITAAWPLADAKYALNNVAEVRRDCVVLISPLLASVYNNTGAEAAAIVVDRSSTLNANSSYGIMDSGWKYQYDKYNDVYRWIPLNGDIAGICALTDDIADPWFSPAGINRGQIKNVVKLAWSPNQTERDTLYKSGINPVVSPPGEGTYLFGDKTLLTKPSAFDRINVRRLFIVLEKAVATAAKYQLFEFNDAFTRAQFKNMVEPFLRDVKGRRGIYDFRVICDETNNTGEVIDRNEFVASIFVKPARSINFITLNFIATRSGVSFEEVAGA